MWFADDLFHELVQVICIHLPIIVSFSIMPQTVFDHKFDHKLHTVFCGKRKIKVRIVHNLRNMP